MADNAVLKHAQREKQRLEELLNRDPNFRKWRAMKAVVDEYEHGPVTAQAVAAANSPAAIPAGPAQTPNLKPQSNSKQIVEAGVAYLRKMQRRVQSKELKDAIEAAGVTINGSDKIANVSAHMSGAKSLVNHVRGEGYGLIEWGSANGPSSIRVEDADALFKPH